jgi:hypothetical protein
VDHAGGETSTISIFLIHEQACSVADPGSVAFLTPGSEMKKNPDLGSGIQDPKINIPDHIY